MLQMVILQIRTLRVRGNGRDPDPGNGPMTGIFDDDAGRAAQRNAGGIVIQGSMTLGEPTGAAEAWTRVELQKNGVP